MDPKGHTEAITEIVQEGITENLPNVPGKRLEIQQDKLRRAITVNSIECYVSKFSNV